MGPEDLKTDSDKVSMKRGRSYFPRKTFIIMVISKRLLTSRSFSAEHTQENTAEEDEEISQTLCPQ